MKKNVTSVEAYDHNYIVYCGYMWMSDDVCL